VVTVAEWSLEQKKLTAPTSLFASVAS